MEYTLQTHGERSVCEVPAGLCELMSDIARAVLRAQPPSLYQSIADYLERLVRVRECARGAEPAVRDAWTTAQRLLAYYQSLGVSRAEANRAARTIQAAYRRFSTRRRVEKRQQRAEDVRTALESESFQEYLKTSRLDLKHPSRATSLVYDVYMEFLAQKEAVGNKQRRTSVNTIATVVGGSGFGKQDSLLTNQQQAGQVRASDSLVDIEKQLPEVTQPSERAVKTSSHLGSPPLEIVKGSLSLPVISDSGCLIVNPHREVQLSSVTLCSDEDISKVDKESFVKLPSVLKLPLLAEQKLARELFEIIDSDATRLRHSSRPLIQDVMMQVEQVRLPSALKHRNSNGKPLPTEKGKKTQGHRQMQG